MDTKEIEVMFPSEVLTLSTGKEVIIKPLTLADLPRVAKTFGRLMQYAEEEKSATEVATVALEEVLSLVPYCINVNPSEVPSTDVPDILEIVVKQNITDVVVGKWMALVKKLAEAGGEKAVQSLKNQISPR